MEPRGGRCGHQPNSRGCSLRPSLAHADMCPQIPDTELDYETRDGLRSCGPGMSPLDFGSGGPTRCGGAAAGCVGSPLMSASTAASSSCISDCSSFSGTCSTSSSSGSWDECAPVTRTDYSVTTSDNVVLRLVRGTCPTSTSKRAHPVLLVPGLASSADATWDITPRYSLFDHLARQGYDVWRVDLRGNGISDAPDSKISEPGWCVDDHLFLDLPPVVKLVLEESGTEQLHWVGECWAGRSVSVSVVAEGGLCYSLPPPFCPDVYASPVHSSHPNVSPQVTLWAACLLQGPSPCRATSPKRSAA